MLAAAGENGSGDRTVGVVAILLILIYRSPLLWLVPLAVAGVADYLSMGVAYGLNSAFGTTVSGQSAGIMTILVFGVGTDYALLLIARYREELRRIERPYDAMRAALRGCGPAVLASSGTVAAGLLCLLAADLNSSRGMGPLGTVGVLCALLAMLTLLPALLVLLGRRVFWPMVPAFGSRPKERRSLFTAMGSSARRRPLAVLAGGVVLLGALATGMLNLPGAVKQEDSFVDKPEAVVAMETLAAAYPEQSTQPLDVITPSGQVDETLAAVRDHDGVASAERGRSGDGWTEISVIAKDPPQSAGETETIESLRSELDGSYLGGPSAEQIDLKDTNMPHPRETPSTSPPRESPSRERLPAWHSGPAPDTGACEAARTRGRAGYGPVERASRHHARTGEAGVNPALARNREPPLVVSRNAPSRT